MDNQNNDNGGNDLNQDANEGSKKLKLSITRMKKLRTGIQSGGLSKGNDHTASVTWAY